MDVTLDRLRARDLPTHLYRVHYIGSRTCFDDSNPSGPLSAADTTTFSSTSSTPLNLYHFRHSVQNQFNWKNRHPQPFISVFSDKDYARNWALDAPWAKYSGGSKECKLLTIDTSKLDDSVYVFKLSDLIRDLGVELPDRASQHGNGAYVFLHRIPRDAIVKAQGGEELKEGRVDPVKFLLVVLIEDVERALEWGAQQERQSQANSEALARIVEERGLKPRPLGPMPGFG